MKDLKLEIKIEEVNVDDGFYEVHYKYRINGKEWENDMYDSDFDNGKSDKEWKKELENCINKIVKDSFKEFIISKNPPETPNSLEE